MTEDEISRHVVECAIEVHRTLGGPGLLESVYEEAFLWELQQRGLAGERQLLFRIPYKGRRLAAKLRIDLIVDGKVIVECKAVSQYNSIFEVQTLTYLRLTGLRLGMVVNFGERVVKDGIHRGKRESDRRIRYGIIHLSECLSQIQSSVSIFDCVFPAQRDPVTGGCIAFIACEISSSR